MLALIVLLLRVLILDMMAVLAVVANKLMVLEEEVGIHLQQPHLKEMMVGTAKEVVEEEAVVLLPQEMMVLLVATEMEEMVKHLQ
ncbi:MAG: hypothetical protein CME98_19975 [Hyphomonas sp.]|nr:hypothetical protein [Hyphomonas sp.]